MKTTRFLVALVLLAVPLVGCLPTQRVIWSPDGTQAAVLGGKEGVMLYLCDEDGVLSGPFGTNVNLVAWFSDSERFIITRSIGSDAWSDIDAWLDVPTKAWLIPAAEALLAASPTRDAWEAGVDALFEKQAATAAEVDAMKLYLAHARMDTIPPEVRDAWGELKPVGVNLIDVGRMVDGKVVWGPSPASSLLPVFDLRIAPSERALAFTTGDPFSDEEKSTALRVVSIDGRAFAETISPHASMYPDWSPDGRYLVYVEPAGKEIVDDDAVLGLVVRKEVLDEQGRLRADLGEQKAEELAVVLYSADLRTRCLPDGRILFAAIDARLPATLEDVPSFTQLFMVEPERPSTLVRVLPRSQEARMSTLFMQLFEVSPDGRHVAVAGEDERFAVFALKDGVLCELARSPDEEDPRMLPSWRGNHEVCYLRPISDTNAAVNAEVVLHAFEGDAEPRSLSRNWPGVVTEGFLD